MTQAKVLQFKITLRGLRPPIWRRIQVPLDYTFWELHGAIQDAMGWDDYHLHMFSVTTPGKQRPTLIGAPEGSQSDELAGWEVPVRKYFRKAGDRVAYEYDFGDGWLHDIRLEDTVAAKAGVAYPVCIAGKRACPPEDSGGVPGYSNLLYALENPDHPQAKELLEWLGGMLPMGEQFEPARFDPGEVTFSGLQVLVEQPHESEVLD